MSVRRQEKDRSAEKAENLNSTLRPSSFKVFQRKASIQPSPQRVSQIIDTPSSNQKRNHVQFQHQNYGTRSKRSNSKPEEGSIGQHCTCDTKIKSVFEKLAVIQSRIEMINLKLQESMTSRDLADTKHLQTFNRVLNLEKKSQKVEYCLWELRELNRSDRQEMQKVSQRMANINQQFIGDFKILAQRLDMLSINQSPEDLRHKFEQVRNQQNKKLKNMYEALEDMGNLQASVVQSVNGLKVEVERIKSEKDQEMLLTGSSRPLSSYNGKENCLRNQLGDGWKASTLNQRKNSYY